MPSPAVPQRWEVFLSSTVRDLEDYRAGVKSAFDALKMACFPSEGWVNPHAGTEARCRQMFQRANSFVLLLGYWYGWIGQPGSKSITQKEFDWAISRWDTAGAEVPTAVLLPTAGSRAAIELEARAKALVSDPANAVDAVAHDANVRAFQNLATNSGRTVNWFDDIQDLRFKVSVVTREWNGDTPMAAARAGAAAAEPPPIADGEFGDLGRVPQFEAVADARAALKDEPKAPALALLAYGDADSAQSCFFERLLVRELRQPARRCSTVPKGCADVGLLCEMTAQMFGLNLGGTSTPAHLAECIEAPLRERALAFVLDRAGNFGRGVGDVESLFWAPLARRLTELHAMQPLPHRLTALFGDFSGRADAWLTGRAPSVMRDRLVELPRFGPFRRSDLYKWLARRGIADARQGVIVDEAMTDDAGNDDPLPLRVIFRLRRRHDLQPDTEDDE